MRPDAGTSVQRFPLRTNANAGLWPDAVRPEKKTAKTG
jgi:hypothetical protein